MQVRYETKTIRVNDADVVLHRRIDGSLRGKHGNPWMQCDTVRLKTDMPMVVEEILGVGAKKTALYGSGSLGTPGHLDRNRKIIRISQGGSLRKKHQELHGIIVQRDLHAKQCELVYLKEDLIFDPTRRVDKPVEGAFAVLNGQVLVPGTTHHKINLKD